MIAGHEEAPRPVGRGKVSLAVGSGLTLREFAERWAARVFLFVAVTLGSFVGSYLTQMWLSG